MELRILKADETLTHVALEGRLDLQGAKEIELQVVGSICTRRKPALIDLSGVTFLASYGIRVLLSAAKSLRADSLPLVLLKPQPQVENVLRVANIHEIVPIENDVEQARKLLGI